MKTIHGTVSSGMCVATGVLAPCLGLIEIRSGLQLVGGTLNVKLDQLVTIRGDFVLEVGECNGYESITFQKCKIDGRDALIMLTSTQAEQQLETHPLDVVEIMAGVKLRATAGYVDGTRVMVESDF